MRSVNTSGGLFNYSHLLCCRRTNEVNLSMSIIAAIVETVLVIRKKLVGRLVRTLPIFYVKNGSYTKKKKMKKN